MVLNRCAFTLMKISRIKCIVRHHVSAHDLRSVTMEAAKMQLVLSLLSQRITANSGRRLQPIPSSRRRMVVRFNHFKAKQRSSRLFLILSMALLATLVPHPRMQWTV